MSLSGKKDAVVRATELSNEDFWPSSLFGLALFHDVSKEHMQTLMEDCERRDITSGQILLSPDEPNEYVFVILSGALNVHIGSTDAPVLTTMGVGECAGEMSIIEDRDPSAYVIAREPTHLLVMHQSILWRMVNTSREFSRNLLIVLSERVRSHNHCIAESFGNLQRFERNATTDALTGLGNRHAMDESYPREISRYQQDRKPVSLIMIDVDQFKTFNDKFGHVAGDRALSAVAGVLQDQFRQRDLLVRYGGDEFAVLLPGVGEVEAIMIADRVRKAVAGSGEEIGDSVIRIAVKISLGVAQLTKNGTYDSLLRAADKALYRAKHAGRNTVSA